jgi:hypothetical protein
VFKCPIDKNSHNTYQSTSIPHITRISKLGLRERPRGAIGALEAALERCLDSWLNTSHHCTEKHAGSRQVAARWFFFLSLSAALT